MAIKNSMRRLEGKDTRAHLSNEVYGRIKRADSKSHLHYEAILSKIADVRVEKVRKYGEQGYEMLDNDFAHWMRLCDVNRKHQRLLTLTRLAVDGDKDAIEALYDAYLDIANYGIMGAQVLELLHDNMEKENER